MPPFFTARYPRLNNPGFDTLHKFSGAKFASHRGIMVSRLKSSLSIFHGTSGRKSGGGCRWVTRVQAWLKSCSESYFHQCSGILPYSLSFLALDFLECVYCIVCERRSHIMQYAHSRNSSAQSAKSQFLVLAGSVEAL